MEKTKRKNDEAIAVYKSISLGKMPTVLVSLGFGCISAAIVILPFLTIPLNSWISWLFLIVMVLLVLTINMVLFALNNQKIIIYRDGLELQSFGNRSFARWDDMLYMENRPVGRAEVVGIATAKRNQDDTSGWLPQLYEDEMNQNFLPISGVITIPLISHRIREVDREKFQRTEFGQILFTHAPHLFQKFRVINRKKSKNGKSKTQE